ncbi:MAG: LptA/OstA family protein [Bacteriovorax sp.]|nr:LptA/OstA family protein [Bacteriovorax sp.]
MKIRQYSIIFIFLSACLGLGFLSYMGHFNQFGSEHALPPKGPEHDAVDESFFKNVNYYSVENSRPFLELESIELSISSSDGVVIGFDPIGSIYRYEKETDKALEPVYFQAKNSRALIKKKEIFLENEVEIKMSNTNLRAQKVSILSEGEILYANRDVKTLSTVEKTSDEIMVNSNRATYRPKLQTIEYQGSVNGVIKRKRVYEENISFKTDLLTLNAPKSLVEMKGNVAFKKDNLEAFANRGEVFLENYNKRLKYYALYDDVRLQERLLNDGKPLVRKAFAEKLEGLISEKKIILTGLPKVFQERDVIKGNRITIRENVETVEVDDANTNITLEKDKD